MKINEHVFFARKLDYDYRVITRGEGVWIWDENGKKYLDGCSGANVASIGHGVREIGEAMARQAEKIAFVPPQHFLNEPTLEFCRRLLDKVPGHYSRVMLCSGGSEAIENALKIARQHHVYAGNASKYRTVSRWQGFHGNTLAADAVGGTTTRRSISSPMLLDVEHIVASNCFRCAYKLKYPQCGLLCARDLERVIIQQGPENVSAFICETVVGAVAAAATPVKEYFPLIREICDRYNILWIADEIMAGAGRTGTYLAIEHWGVYPDIVVLAKGLSCGYAPLSAILVSDKVWKPYIEHKQPYIGGHTYNAHPVTASVGLAVLDYVEKHHVYEQVEEKGRILEQGLQRIKEKYEIVGDVRGIGLFRGLEFVQNKSGNQPFSPSLNVAARASEKAQDYGLIVYPVRACADGRNGDGLLICPPLVISEDEIGFLLRALEKTVQEMQDELKA
jgi:adenosylmethionine-8-amino-7-oxononanoate aminotransferase